LRVEAQLESPTEQRVTGKRAYAKEQNRRIILDAARRVFAQLGYSGTTVRDVIRATPLASGTFYNYFRSKEEVFQAMRDETALALRPVLREARLKAETAEAFVAETFRAFFGYVVASRASLGAVQRSEAVHVRVDTPEVLAGFEELRSDLDAAIARGLFPPVDAECLTACIVGIAFEMAGVLQRRDGFGSAEATRFATGLVMGALAAACERPRPAATAA
jgi:AcrR family transcriptional regulator